MKHRNLYLFLPGQKSKPAAFGLRIAAIFAIQNPMSAKAFGYLYLIRRKKGCNNNPVPAFHAINLILQAPDEFLVTPIMLYCDRQWLVFLACVKADFPMYRHAARRTQNHIMPDLLNASIQSEDYTG